ncbi:MAG: glutamate--cysteine ligase [Gammaproteobacteria bacterium]|nr:glutamate--cysteine ligase [Gammaproteobacteria bacterium]
MYQSAEKRLSTISAEGLSHLLASGLKGLEKESLRVAPDGGIAQTPHPRPLGSALTHPYITTDYSEALIELITPPFREIRQALTFLQDLQKFVCGELRDEILWATSMPCVLAGGENIPIARYGDSNEGIMKSVYRRGLGHRYGRSMQVIAGVHFNYSLDPGFWPHLQRLEGDRQPERGFVDRMYMGLTRNLLRYGWLIPYLFGASPAVCKSFLGGKPNSLADFDANTYYEPYATSLRLGDFGYTNSKEKGVGIKASYNSLEAYINSLTRAIKTPSPTWEKIGVVVNGRYEQLNANILQIENEYYSTVRPKQLLAGLEMPVLALQRRGVQYIELRSLDVNAYDPLGVSGEQIAFLEAFMLFCLLQDSPPISLQEQREIDQNQGGVAHRGRDPELHLWRWGQEVRLRDWAGEICSEMAALCELLDAESGGGVFSTTLARQVAKVADPDLTPSAQMLREMRANREGFFHFAQRLSLLHHDYFRQLAMDGERLRLFREESERSHARQAEMERAPKKGFTEFLQHYFSQSDS